MLTILSLLQEGNPRIAGPGVSAIYICPISVTHIK